MRKVPARHLETALPLPQAEDSAARAFSVGFYANINKQLARQRQRQRNDGTVFAFVKHLLLGGKSSKMLAVDEAFEAGCSSFEEQGFRFGDPEDWFHQPGHPHTYRPDFTNCQHCVPPVHGTCLLLQCGSDGEVITNVAGVQRERANSVWHRALRTSRVDIRSSERK
eukprot:3290007-Prymnesium_polylepis.2